MRFKDYPKRFENTLLYTIEKSLNETLAKALKENLPIKTGRLTRSVEVVRIKDERNKRLFAVTAGGRFRINRRQLAPGLYGFINKKVRAEWEQVVENTKREVSLKTQRNLTREVK